MIAIVSLCIQVLGVAPRLGAALALGSVGGVALMSCAAAWKRYKRIRSLPFRLLEEDTDYLHRIYRRLDQDARDRVPLPLNQASWPQIGERFDFVQLTLFSHYDRVIWLVLTARQIWNEERWETNGIELFRVNETTVMADLLEALGAFRETLREKYK